MKLSPTFTLPPHLVLVLRPLFSQYFGHILIWTLSSQLDTEEALSLYVLYSLLWKQCLARSRNSGILPLSNPPQEYVLSNLLYVLIRVSEMQFLFKIQKDLYTSEEFLWDMTWLCINLHLPAKTRKCLQLSKLFFSVSKLRLLTNRRRYHFHSSS